MKSTGINDNNNSDDNDSSVLEMENIESPVEYFRDHSTLHPELTKKELWSWYVYDFASQPFSSAAMSLFIPLILEDLAWRSGTSNLSNPSHPPCQDRSSGTISDDAPCFVKFGIIYTTPVAFALYCSSISVAIQVFSFISLGAFADYSKWRKHFLVGFSCINALMSIAFLAVIKPQWYHLAAVLTILGNVAYGTAMVFYNAYLPLLTEAHPSIRKFKAELETEFVRDYTNNLHDSYSLPTLASTTELSSDLNDIKEEKLHHLNELTDRVSNKISTHGFAFGYVGGVLSVLIFFGILYAFKAGTYVMQVCVALCGIWMLAGLLLFTLPWLKTRPGPPFPSHESSIVFSWKRTLKTLQRCRNLKNAFLFLLSWFFYSDGYSSIATTAILFGKSALNMSNTQLMIISLITPFLAVLGNLFFLHVVRNRLHLQSKTVLILAIVLVTLIPFYGMLGFIVPEKWPIGIKSVTEMYILGSCYGFLIGALQSFSRSIFSDLVPAGMESEFFALYEITDRGSSWLGPLIIGVFAQSFGVRYGFIAIFVILLISLPFLVMVDMKKGREEARTFQINQDKN